MYAFAHRPMGKGKHYSQKTIPPKAQTSTADRTPPTLQLHRNLGNQAIQRLYSNESSLSGQNQVGMDTDTSLVSTLCTTRGSGESLPEPIKTFMEASLGRRLDRVRVHTGRRAEAMTKTLDAAAFTFGRNVYFNSGRYSPTTTKGARLLAHELVHTVQQDFHDGQIPNSLPISTPEEPSEKQAETVATQIVGDTSISHRHANPLGNMNSHRIQPRIQMASNFDVAIYETKDHGAGWEDAPSESTKLEANSIKEAGSKLNYFIKAARKLFGSSSAIKQLSFYGHGAPGYQSVGAGESYDAAKEISVASIDTYPDDYKKIYNPLLEGASVYLRGCNVGAGPAGLALLKKVKSSCKTLSGKDIEAYGWTGKSYHMRRLWYDWYKQTGELVSSGEKAPKITWEKLKKRSAGKKK